MNLTRLAEMKIYTFHTNQTKTCNSNNTQHFSIVMITELSREMKENAETDTAVSFSYPSKHLYIFTNSSIQKTK